MKISLGTISLVIICFRRIHRHAKTRNSTQKMAENHEILILLETLLYIISGSMSCKIETLHFKVYAVIWCIRQIQFKNVR